ncbi:MAG TPA: HAMP domain-containing sensor histidine kinase [Myxococcota bacterium]|nr:HAMP domain-containing sensor histidine kinase [Myxococcota bacterium]
MHRLTNRLIRAILRRLDPGRGEVRVLADAVHMRGLLRLAWVFVITVFAPGMTLAWIGFGSIRGEELQVWKDVEESGDREIREVLSHVDATFKDFEASARARLESGRSPVEDPKTLSPYVRVAFRLDEEGNLEAPFQIVDRPTLQDHSVYFGDSWRRANHVEDPALAVGAWDELAQEVADPQAVGQALFNKASSLGRAGDTRAAEELLANLYADYHDVRNLHGFRIGDLARLRRGELLLDRDPEIGRGALETLIDELLEEEWTIGRGNEAAVAARGLELLEETSEKDWLASRRGRLQEQARQLFWAERLYDELMSLNPRGRALPVDRGQIAWRLEDQALWATMWWGEDGQDLYAFALDPEAVLGDIRDHARRTTRTSAEVNMLLLSPDADAPSDALVRRSLKPWLPGWSLVVHPRSAADLNDAQERKRLQRLAILILSLMMIGTGAVLTGRLVVQQLEVARSKADFAANVSHELRSPITQIRIKGESLQFGLVDSQEDLQDHYDAIVRESERLSRLVDNVLDFAAIERGAKTYTMRAEDLGETVRQAVESARFSMETRDMKMDIDVPDSLPVVMHDPEAIAQVVHNLISNAAKYGKKGGWIGVRGWVGSDEAHVAVSDKGIGIRQEEIPLLFEHFFRSSDPDARRQKGTGIGLTIVRYIMDAHSGRVEVTSVPGQGSTFTLHFPLRPQPHS